MPATAAAVLAVVVLIGLLAVAFLGRSRPAATAPSSSPSLAAASPAWLAGLMQDYRDACGPNDVDQVSADVAAMGEEEARDYVEGLIDACDEGKPGKGRGRGNGGGGG